MNLFKFALASAVAGPVALFAGAAQADVTWAWSYVGQGISASGTFITAGSATAPEDILSISGQRNGVQILGLVPIGDPTGNMVFTWDNQFINAFPYFTYDGLLFNLGGGIDGYVNVFGDFDGTGYANFEFGANVSYEFRPITLTVAQVPEAPTLLYMALGLVAFGVLRQKRAGLQCPQATA